MTPRTTVLLQRALLLLVAAVVGSVAWSVRRPGPAGPAALPSPEPQAAPDSTRVGDLVFRRFKGENEGFVLKAKGMVGREGDETNFQGVEVQISYLARGEPGKATVTAAACRLSAGETHAVFQGAVRVRTEDGFELETETLLYNGNKGTVKTADPVRFARKTLSGTATGLQYRAEDGALTLDADVALDIASETGPPARIVADHAEGSREDRQLRFSGQVRVDQGADSLRCGRLDLDLNEDLTAATRAVAVDDVELRTSAAAPLPGAAPTGKAKGPRTLKARKLDIWFRDDRSLREATAFPDAELVVLPGPGEPRERRRISAKVLAFVFDDLGRLEEVRAQRDAVLSAEPLRPAQGSPRVVTAGNLTARLAPESGDLRTVHFDKDVEFREGGRVGRGRTARFEGEGGLLVLEGDPLVVDEVAGTELKAQVIEIAQATGDLAARGKVRQARKAKARAGGDGGFLSGEGAPTVVVAQKLKYEARPRRAQYEGEALLRNGKDEVRADTLVLEEPGPGQSRLTATGRVVSRLQPRPGKEGGTPQAAVEGRADEMRYEEKTGEIRYTGTVTLQQGDIKTKSPRATLYLAADGRGLERLEAGEPAEVEQGTRRASGAHATYTPGTETVVLVGDKVRLQDPGQAVEGRTITFYVGDDRIVVDGQEQARTEAIIRREPRRP